MTILTNDPDRNDPDRRCTCGWRRFRTTAALSNKATTRWVFYDASQSSGFGATEFGTYFGGGSSGAWGEFNTTLRSCGQEVRCENCTRLRRAQTSSSAAILGGYVFGSNFYVVTSDVTETGCLSLEWRGPVTVAGTLKVTSDPLVPLLISDNPVTGPLASPPSGAALADALLMAPLPAVPVSGEYTVVLLNSCCGYEISLGTVSLEVDVIVLNPTDADLNGFPEMWLRTGGSPAQPGSGSLKSLPFAYCSGVIEYDARFGTDPAAQGWTHQAGGGSGLPGDFTLVDGGLLRVQTPGGTNPSYWEGDLAGAIPTIINSYMSNQPGISGGSGFGEGFDFQALKEANGFVFTGTRETFRSTSLFHTLLDASGETAWAIAGEDRVNFPDTGTLRGSVGDSFTYLDGDIERGSFHGTGPVGAQDGIRARFGDVEGEGVTAGYLRNFVVSTPGRFLRAGFRAYTTVASPILRLYLMSDVDSAGEPSARFLVRYGPIIPHTIPALQAGVSISFVTRNTSFEVPVTLPGLTANAPFWFTVERDWAHADDKTEASVHLLQATVRGA